MSGARPRFASRPRGAARAAPVLPGAVWAGALLVVGCGAVQSYLDPEGPRYAGAPVHAADDPEAELRVISFNVEFARHVDVAVEELTAHASLRDVDVLLMQEMNEPGVVAVSRALGLHYVYYPATARGSGGFGNAVLSRWPIVEDHKLVLPHPSPANGERRVATVATIDAPFGHLVAASVHTETPWMPLRGRLEQLAHVLADVEARYDPLRTFVVIGGDMNTPEAHGAAQIDGLFTRHGYVWASEGVGPTADYYFGFVRLDYLFVRGVRVLDAGTVPTRASDHRPVFVLGDPSAPAL